MRKAVTRRPAATTSVAVLTIGLTMGLMSRTDALRLRFPPVAPQTSYRPVAEMELRSWANRQICVSAPRRAAGCSQAAPRHEGHRLERVSRGWARVEANNTQGYVDTEQGVMALDLDQGF